MIHFDFVNFLADQLISLPELAKETGIEYTSLFKMQQRGTVKPLILRQIKEKYSSAEKYILSQKKTKRSR